MEFVFWAKDVYPLDHEKNVTGYEKFSDSKRQIPERIF
tara:strand:+ start:458 stop:571 length:114 start_codon:yes stop_codon:yes gene_type:complete